MEIFQMACMISPTPFIRPSQLHYFTTLRSAKIRALKSPNLTQSTKIRACINAESDKLPSDVRNRAIHAIDSSGRRVTVADVMSKSSLDLNEAQNALQALAVDTRGSLEVSDEGDLVYVFPKNYHLKLVTTSFKTKFESFLEKLKMAAFLLAKVSFAISLTLPSVFPVTTVLFAALFVSVVQPPEENLPLCFLYDLLSSLCRGKLIDHIFSVVFGDGDPNRGIEEKRWEMIGQCIAQNGGVITAEDVAPYLDPKITENMDDDSYMLPVLVRFNGQPVVDEEGNILYDFPSVQWIPTQRRRGKVIQEKFLKENKWNFSKYNNEVIEFVNILLGYNLAWAISHSVCVAEILSSSLSEFERLLYHTLLYVHLMYIIYAILFLVIKLLRPLFSRDKNAEIGKRNEDREQLASVLESPDLSLKQKLLRARNMAQRNGRNLYDNEDDKRGWDQRLKDK